MSIRVLFAARPDSWAEYEAPLRKAFEEAGIAAELGPDLGPPETVDYIIYAPNSAVQDFTPYLSTKAVLNLWAGVEDAVGNQTLTQPFARMVDKGLTQGMIEWVTGHVLRHHLGMDVHIRKAGEWDDLHHVPPLAGDRRVTILGLGALGRACGLMLASLGFAVTGWSRTPKQIDGITCLSGQSGLEQALGTSEILVLLLPLTAQTTNIIDEKALAMMPAGVVIVNPGRGPLIDDDALLAGLDSGHVAHATLDVFREEPLPGKHPFWANPNVTITPHIASETRPSSAARVIAENIGRGEAGLSFLHLVDRARGY
ncbi:MAG: glyoxylate/hydroxypyruvate reductase A [Paracoccaceae bacterium]|jgi:glyoxylate/hydroxypyruvate reductase A